MSLTLKVFLDTRRKNSKKIYPLKVRVTLDRKHKEINLGIKIDEKYWDNKQEKIKPNHPNCSLIQLKISRTLAKIQEGSLKLENQDKSVTSTEIFNLLQKKKATTSFIEFANEQIENLLKAGRIGNSIAYRCAIEKVKKYIGKNELKFEQVDYRFLEDFEISMINDGMKPNAIASYMREIRAIYNKAIKMEIVELKYYPFSKYKIKTEKTINRALTIEEIKSIVKIDLTGYSNLVIHRKLFLLSFSLIGMNFADLLSLKQENIINGRVIFQRKKTKKVYSIKLLEISKQLVKDLQLSTNINSNYILPFVKSNETNLQQKKDIGLVIHNTNDNLKRIAQILKINKPISTYYARYTWANIAKSLGYSKDLIAEALGHEYGNKVTGIYLDNFDKELIDEMNEKVMNVVFDNYQNKTFV